MLCASYFSQVNANGTILSLPQQLTSNKRDEKMAAAVAKLRRSESAKEEEEKKKVKTDVIIMTVGRLKAFSQVWEGGLSRFELWPAHP